MAAEMQAPRVPDGWSPRGLGRWLTLVLFGACSPNATGQGSSTAQVVDDDDAASTSGTPLPATSAIPPGDSGDDTEMGTSTGPGSETTTDAESSTGATTTGDGCRVAEDCPRGWICIAPDCVDPPEGDACVDERQCGATAPFCPFDGMCHDGSEADPCDGGHQCVEPLLCSFMGACQDGGEGDPCNADAQCGAAAPFCAFDNQCHDGSLGDPCNGDEQCVGMSCDMGACV